MTTAQPTVVGTTAEAAEAAARFVSPATRHLLTTEGLTTALLESRAGGPMRMAHVGHRVVPPDQAPAEAVTLLGGGGPLVVRDSLIAGPARRVWSANQVVGRLDLSAEAAACLRGDALLGFALRAAGIGRRRTLVEVGRCPWPLAVPKGPVPPAAFRRYVIWHGDDEALAVVREVFNPSLVEAGWAEGAHP
ncbi:hypothetical protein [Streptomyces sp. NPDC006997]|uniref:hypothetical protein n=1 Tax=Streptomyces sp. NPDC006997 TaxID=3155356 RepID=UPI0033EC30EB